MAHMLEEAEDGTVSMAYAGETPWHNLGTRVPPDLTPEQMLKAAKLDWDVAILPSFYNPPVLEKMVIHDPIYGDCFVPQEMKHLNYRPLVRLSDGEKLSEVQGNWNPLQNSEAFEFFNDFVAAGDMEMHTAGSLCGGELVWALAKIKDGMSISVNKRKGDRVDSYLLFTNPHRYGKAIDIRFTPIRVVCNNTLTLALGAGNTDKVVRISHKVKFDPNMVKETLGIAHHKLEEYKERGNFLASKKYKDEDIVTYFKRIFPLNRPKEDTKKTLSKQAELCSKIVELQPGADLYPGTYWNLFNAVTFYTDHIGSKNESTRLETAWYGYNRQKKIDALNVAVEMASAS